MSPSTPASLGLRIAAAVYDLFPLLALWMLTAGLCLLLVHGNVDLAHPPLAWRVALRAALFAVTAAYFVISWSRGGQTIGMRAWRLRVIAMDNEVLTWPRAVLRFVCACLSAAVFGLGFFVCLFRRDRRGWHDLSAGSRMIRLPQ